MATTVKSIRDKLLGLLDQFSEDGVEIPQAEVADIDKKVIMFVDMAQKEMWNLNKSTLVETITNTPPENRLVSGIADMVDYEGVDQFYPDEMGINEVQGYSIMVDCDCVIAYQENVAGIWTDLEVINAVGIDELTTYSGVLTVADTNNPVRLKLSSDAHFRHINRALWKMKYRVDKVPIYSEYVKYELPDNFNGIDAVIVEDGEYVEGASYKLENYRDFYYAFDFVGIIRITYKPIPTDITSMDDVLEIDDVLAQNIIYDLATKIGFYENQDLVNWGEGRRLEGNAGATTDTARSAIMIDETYTF